MTPKEALIEAGLEDSGTVLGGTIVPNGSVFGSAEGDLMPLSRGRAHELARALVEEKAPVEGEVSAGQVGQAIGMKPTPGTTTRPTVGMIHWVGPKR